MTYAEPKKDFLYEFPFYYRVEMRGENPTLILSYREERDGKTTIAFEANPRSTKEIRAWHATGASISELPPEVIRRFLISFIGVDDSKTRDINIARRSALPSLPLGILLTTDKERILSSGKAVRARSSIAADERIIRHLLKEEGSTPWNCVTPKKCVEWLTSCSERDRKDIKRIMLNLFQCQHDLGLCTDNPWVDFNPETVARKRAKHKVLVSKNIEQVMLSDDQCSQIFETCRRRLSAGHVTGVDIAVLLILTLGICVEHLVALDLTDFKPLKEFHSRLGLHITNTVQKSKGGNYMLTEIEDAYQRRFVPTITLVSECWHFLMKKYHLPRNSPRANNTPLVPVKSNKARRLSPKALEEVITQYITETVGLTFTSTIDGTSRPHPPIVDILKTTANHKMIRVGIEDEEARAIKGMRPQLVSAKSYYDRFNEAAMNKIGALLDRWAGYLPTPARNSCCYSCGSHNHRTQAIIRLQLSSISLDDISDEGIVLELTATHGMAITLPNNHKKAHRR